MDVIEGALYQILLTVCGVQHEIYDRLAARHVYVENSEAQVILITASERMN
jgi:hypothetical protein